MSVSLDVLGTVLCEHCAGACCRYVALPLDTPETPRDYDDIRWYLLHEGFSVFVEEGEWYVQIQAKCKQLGPDNRCRIYPTRPEICREYQAGDCDYGGGDYGHDHFFTHASQLEAYACKKLGKPLHPPKTAPPAKRSRIASGLKVKGKNGGARPG